jgi:hypothetical protein
MLVSGLARAARAKANQGTRTDICQISDKCVESIDTKRGRYSTRGCQLAAKLILRREIPRVRRSRLRFSATDGRRLDTVITKKALFGIGLVAIALFGANRVSAAPDPLEGTWGISSAGQAALGSPDSGTCSVNGTVPAALYDSVIQFTGGQIIIHNLGINIGATNCSSPNFQGSGTYTVMDKGDGGFEASGTFSTQFVGRGAACSGISLNTVAFTAIGKTKDGTITVTINGLDSGTYAEGPPPGPTTCTAPILNFTASGAGKKF